MTAPSQAEAKQKGELPPRVFVVLDHFGGPQCVHVVEGNASDSTAAFANALNRACRYVPYVPEAALSEMRESLYFCACGYFAVSKPRISAELQQALDILGDWCPEWIKGHEIFKPLQEQVAALQPQRGPVENGGKK